MSDPPLLVGRVGAAAVLHSVDLVDPPPRGSGAAALTGVLNRCSDVLVTAARVRWMALVAGSWRDSVHAGRHRISQID
jgi:hypothetical protein